MNMKVDEESVKAVVIVNGQTWIVWRFSSNEFLNNGGCLVSAPTFCLGGLRMWEK